MPKPTLTAGESASAAANGFIQVRASGLEPGKSHALAIKVKDGPELPQLIGISDRTGKLTESVYVFVPGRWEFSLIANPKDKPIATCELEVQ